MPDFRIPLPWPETTDKAQLRLLVVDDDDVDRERVRRMLLRTAPDATVVEACDPEETLALLQEQAFDCMIVDYRLGRLTGLDLMDLIREVVPQRCATIMVTGLGDEEIAGAAVRSGINDYLTKNQLDPVGLMRSVTGAMRRTALERRLHELAYYDALTGLASRTLLTDRLQQLIARRAREPGMLAALAYIDLDHFKPINDRHGHHAGDQVLGVIAQRLKGAIRASDTAARLGGDEFALLLTEVESAEDCEAVLERISRLLREPIRLDGRSDGQTVQVTASIGVVLIQDDSLEADSVLRHADHMMYEVKNAGREGVRFFDPQVERRLKAAHDELEAVAAGLRDGEFELFYQPQIDLATRAPTGLEALIRWRHPQRGLLAPDAFWNALQHKKLSATLGEWVIASACRQIDAWLAAGLRLKVSVNVSVHHLLHPSFAARLGAILAATPSVPPGYLELEILETVAIDDFESTVAVIEACKALGVSVALDDFGTGYSSLTHLRSLPLDALKIDRSFIASMLDSPSDQAIVLGILGLCRAFNRRAIAEGVESEAHIRRLVELGCHCGQGYGIARPMPAAEVAGWIERQRACVAA